MSADRLELLLRDTVNDIEFPDTPELSLAVATRIARSPLPAERHPSRRMVGLKLRPALAIGIVIVLIGFFTLAFSPTARRAVADFLGVLGIRISVTDDVQIPAPSNDVEIDLGTRASVPRAFDEVEFPVKTPTVDAVDGMGTAVYVDRSIGDSGMLSLVYPHDARTYSDVELLITQFEASVDETFMKKTLAAGAEVRFVDVRGTTGFWVSGDPHLFYYLQSDGDLREESLRLAGNVLLWEEAGITYRIEGTETLTEAQRIAASLR